MLLMLIAMALTVLAYYLTDSLGYAIVFLVAMVLLNKTLQPYVTLLSNKLFPKPEVKLFREFGMDGEDIAGRGFRAVVVTQDNAFDPDKAESAALYDELVEKAVHLAGEKSDVFSVRYDAVMRRGLPREYCWCLCGEKDSGVRKCYKAWLMHINTKDFGVWKENSELFLCDVQFCKPGDETLYAAAVMFMFDSRLPKTAQPASEEAPQAHEPAGE